MQMYKKNNIYYSHSPPLPPDDLKNYTPMITNKSSAFTSGIPIVPTIWSSSSSLIWKPSSRNNINNNYYFL